MREFSVRQQSEPIEIAGEVRSESERAYQFFDGVRTVWLPKSQCAWDGRATMEMPEWLAKEKELI